MSSSPIGFLRRSAEVYPQRTSVIHGERRYTWRETLERCRRLASVLAKNGIGRGDTVAVMAPNVPEAADGSGTVTLGGLNTYTGGTSVTSGVLEILPTATPSATTSALAKGAVAISGSGKLALAANVTQGSQSGNAPVTAPTSNVNITSLSITGTGTLDIGNNRIIVDYTTGNDPNASIA